MTEFTSVVGSTGLDFDPHAGEQNVCPRVLLGFTCLVNEYECLCEQVESAEVYGTKNDRNEVSILTVELNLIPQVGSPRSVMAGVELMGYKSHFQASKDVVVVSFNLRRAENAALADYVKEVGF